MRLAAAPVAVLSMAAAAAAQEAAPIDLEPVVVETAARDARPLLETPVAATVVDRETIERRQAVTFQELIGDMPGVSIGGGPRGIAQEPNIRGFTDEQIVLRIDGGRMNFNQGHRGRFFIDPDILDSIEIVRGGGSTLYGSGALGGVISLVTRDPRDMLAPGQTVGARVRAGYASNGQALSTSVTAYGAAENVDALGFLGFRPQFEDFEDGDGDPILDSAIDVFNGLAKVGVNAGESHRFTLSGSWYEDSGETAPNANAASTADTRVDRDGRVATLRGGWEYAPAGSSLIDLSTVVYFNDYQIEEDRDADGRRDETTYRTLGIEIVNRSKADIGLPVTFVYGVEAYRDEQTGKRDGAARPEFPDASVDFYGIFAEATVRLTDTLELSPGLRFDSFSLDPDGSFPDRTESAVSPRIGLSWRPLPTLQLYGNVGQAFRAPSLTELYTDGLHFRVPNGFGPGTEVRNNFVPNPSLDPEKALQFEIGARVDRRDVFRPKDRLTLGLNAYYADVRDYIDQVVTYVDPTIPPTFVPGTGMVFFGTTSTRNVDATLWGVEAEARYDAGAWFAGLSGMLPDGEGENGDALGSVPADRLTVTLGARPSRGWEVGGRVTLARGKDDVPAGTEPEPGYAVFDLFTSYAPVDGPLAGAVFRAGIDNLLDRDYRIYPNGLDEPGRTFKVSGSLTF